ncbi:MAG: hypothetical protein KDD19_05580 [Phaeodactylibacter sp.]|nr:hypothetical protein [Phaeodactylibacter sp.]
MKDERQHLKIQLYEHCLAQVSQSIQTARAALEAAQESGNEETKSSAGDKYETGRTMMQLEQEKYKVQLLKAIELKNQLAQLRPGQPGETAEPGSLVFTNLGNFYLAVGLGKVRLEGLLYFVISLESPLGRQMRGKKKGEGFTFQGKAYMVEEIV